MPQFRKLSTAEVIELLKTFQFTRKIVQWHIHHTWRPDYSNFNGSNHLELHQGMRDYHVNTNGWSDIAQHFTLFPDGTWVTGRDLNKDPASILGWNTGAICIEMIGNFDVGHDQMTDAQKKAIYEATEFAVEHLKLKPLFHRDSPTAGKTCPGSGINRDTFMNEMINFTENKLAAEEAKRREEEMKKTIEEVRVMFTDMKTHWANQYVNFCADKKIIKGIKNEDGTYRYEPDRPITRAEAATIVARAYESLEEQVEVKLNRIITALQNAGIQV